LYYIGRERGWGGKISKKYSEKILYPSQLSFTHAYVDSKVKHVFI